MKLKCTETLKYELERMSYDCIFTTDEQHELWTLARNENNRVFLQKAVDKYTDIKIERLR